MSPRASSALWCYCAERVQATVSDHIAAGNRRVNGEQRVCGCRGRARNIAPSNQQRRKSTATKCYVQGNQRKTQARTQPHRISIRNNGPIPNSVISSPTRNQYFVHIPTDILQRGALRPQRAEAAPYPITVLQGALELLTIGEDRGVAHPLLRAKLAEHERVRAGLCVAACLVRRPLSLAVEDRGRCLLWRGPDEIERIRGGLDEFAHGGLGGGLAGLAFGKELAPGVEPVFADDRMREDVRGPAAGKLVGLRGSEEILSEECEEDILPRPKVQPAGPHPASDLEPDGR
ncbi:hypothetical protein BDK51DRAFT_52886 [Blyttiomyces helicus]|uniref:Uncharacterized protein n=1 Tax=Blyttiomyces helicus TaxID=388810 RepID=A0A4P9W2Q1_9FUNG|nr:hypothetical protein BDK51DRAFT_52886 [Blyttiomyces helicus]|eukprot:RKO84880.1 hypothetical protein BDK51DRAFT_52886 [Blyttiomyces helicus]